MVHRQRLLGKRALIVEDSWAQALSMRDVLEDAGAVVVGLAKDSLEATGILNATAPDAAVVDLQLSFGTAHTLMHLLDLRKIPYVIVTGHVAEVTKLRSGVTVLQKPLSNEDLVTAVESLLAGRTAQQLGKINEN